MPPQSSPCDALDIPKYLRRSGRQARNSFPNEKERLFRWFPPGIQYAADGQLSAASLPDIFKPPFDISCNRESLCRFPSDVLFNTSEGAHREHCGILAAAVGAIYSAAIEFEVNGQPTSLEFTVEHDPEDCMFPHTLIGVFVAGGRVVRKPSNTAKTFIRDQLALAFRVFHEPNQNFTLKSEPRSTGRYYWWRFKSAFSWNQG